MRSLFVAVREARPLGSALLVLVTLLTALTGCVVGPNYKRPDVSAPPQFHGTDPQNSQPPSSQSPSAQSLADTEWFDIFQDDVLKQLITTALAQNHDLKIAADRVVEARANYGLQQSQLFPTVAASASFTANKASLIGATRLAPGFNLDASYTQAGFNINWQMDVFGRIRRLTEAARAQYLGTEEARHGVTTSLIADVTSTYFQIREFDLELDIARKTEAIAQNGLRLTTVRKNRGAATGLDVHQAEQLLYTATAQIAAIERGIGQSENALNVLLGNDPGDVPRGKLLAEFKTPPQVPAGLPSALLDRRPDIRQAEQNLVAANANIGAAKALLFPQISLTSFLGFQSRALTELFTSPARSFNFVPASALQPIFNAGAIRNGIKLTQAQRDEALEGYKKTIQNAFREVSDALIAYRKDAEQRAQQEKLVEALRESQRLSTLRYQGGLDSYLQVLDAQRNLFTGELTLAQLDREELLSVVQLYRALGGGWE
jgi:NodT family efflux transporter outer membrane factor (OMF) lipoprotein